MGSTYANVTVVGASVDAVKEVLAGSGALLAGVGDDVVVFHPDDDGPGMGSGATAAQLSTALQAPVIESVVVDEDYLVLQVLVGGQVAARAVAPPTGAEIMQDASDDIGSGLTSAEEAAALVAAIGRGDEAKLAAALEADNVFATESHHGAFAALGLPTIGVGWGHRYLEQDRELFDAVPLVTA